MASPMAHNVMPKMSSGGLDMSSSAMPLAPAPSDGLAPPAMPQVTRPR